METGERFEDVELSTIDTTLLLGGILFCQVYFDGEEPEEVAIRAYADSIYRRVDWRWAVGPAAAGEHGMAAGRSLHQGGLARLQRGDAALRAGAWPHPPIRWISPHGKGGPTRTSGELSWARSTWGSRRCSATSTPTCGSTSAASRTSTCGRSGIDYFENSRRATYAQREYAVAESDGVDGLCRGVLGAHRLGRSGETTARRSTAGGGASTATRPGARRSIRSATTARWCRPRPAARVPFAPEITVPVLVAMREKHGEPLFGRYGFLDAFNPSWPANPHPRQAAEPWPAAAGTTSTISASIRGPSSIMAENYRTDLVWRYMRKHPVIIRGLRLAGFRGGWLEKGTAD